MKGRISEVFDSVQGEGIYVGERQIFVRFFGCNLRCKYCDTSLNDFTEYEPGELFEKIRLYGEGFHSVSFTGGEPLLQKSFLKEVLQLTKKTGLVNYLETNGTLPESLEEVIDDVDIIAMDLKLPSSTGMDDHWDAHRRFLNIASRKAVFLKAVICGSTSEADLRQGIGLISRANHPPILVMQPNSFEENNQLEEKLEKFRDICREENVIYCVISQMHKAVGIK